MPPARLELTIEGPDREALASELSQLLADELQQKPQRVVRENSGEGTRDIDPVAVAAVILSIPAVLVATLDLAERLKVKQKVDALLGWAQQRLAGDSRNRITLRARTQSVPLNEADTAQVLKWAAQMEAAPREQQP